MRDYYNNEVGHDGLTQAESDELHFETPAGRRARHQELREAAGFAVMLDEAALLKAQRERDELAQVAYTAKDKEAKRAAWAAVNRAEERAQELFDRYILSVKMMWSWCNHDTARVRQVIAHNYSRSHDAYEALLALPPEDLERVANIIDTHKNQDPTLAAAWLNLERMVNDAKHVVKQRGETKAKPEPVVQSAPRVTVKPEALKERQALLDQRRAHLVWKGLDMRTISALMRENLSTEEDIKAASDETLLRIHGIGSERLAMIRRLIG